MSQYETNTHTRIAIWIVRQAKSTEAGVTLPLVFLIAERMAEWHVVGSSLFIVRS